MNNSMRINITNIRRLIFDKKQMRYLAAGGAAAGVEYLSFTVLFYFIFAESHIILTQIVSYIIGLVFAFTLHYTWTFKSQNSSRLLRQQFVLYTLTAAINLLLSTILISLLVRLQIVAWAAKVIVMAIVVLWNYTILNKFIFNPEKSNRLNIKSLKMTIRRNIETILLMFIVLVIGTVHILTVSPGVGHDEEPHIAKAEATSRLDFLPHQLEGHDYFVGRGSEDLYVYVIRHIQVFYQKSNSDAEKMLRDIETLGDKKYRDTTVGNVPLTGAGGYNSINYIPNSLGIFTARKLNLTIKQTYYAAKFSALFFCTIVIGAAFKLLEKYRSRFIIAIIALFPPVLFSFSGITTDGFLNATSLLFASILLLSFFENSQLNRPIRVIAYLLAITLSITKLPYIFISLILFTSPLTRYDKYRLIKNISLMGLLLAVVLGWNYLVRDATNYTSHKAYCCTSGIQADPKGQISYITRHPDQFAGSIVYFLFDANLADKGRIIMPQEAKSHVLNSDFLLAYLYLMVLISFYAAKDFKDVRTNKMSRYWIGAVFLAALGIVGALYVASNSVGQFTIWGVQTRYFYPLLAFILCYFAMRSPFNFTTKSRQFLRTITIFAIVINVLIATQLYTLPKTFTLNDRIQLNRSNQRP